MCNPYLAALPILQLVVCRRFFPFKLHRKRTAWKHANERRIEGTNRVMESLYCIQN